MPYRGNVKEDAEVLHDVCDAIDRPLPFSGALRSSVESKNVCTEGLRKMMAATLAASRYSLYSPALPRKIADEASRRQDAVRLDIPANQVLPIEPQIAEGIISDLKTRKTFADRNSFLRSLTRDKLQILARYLEQRERSGINQVDPYLMEVIHVTLLELLPDPNDLVTVARAATSSHVLGVLDKHPDPRVRRVTFAREKRLHGGHVDFLYLTANRLSPNKTGILAAIAEDSRLADIARESFASVENGRIETARQIGFTLNGSLEFGKRPGFMKPTLSHLAFNVGSPVLDAVLTTRRDVPPSVLKALYKRHVADLPVTHFAQR